MKTTIKAAVLSLALAMLGAPAGNAADEVDTSKMHQFLGEIINGGMVMIMNGNPPTFGFEQIHSYSSQGRCHSSWVSRGHRIDINWSRIVSTDVWPLQGRPYMRINGSARSDGAAMVFNSESMRQRARNAIHDLMAACATVSSSGY